MEEDFGKTHWDPERQFDRLVVGFLVGRLSACFSDW
jgi:hypothetical protein